jgi:hypothetical protein
MERFAWFYDEMIAQAARLKGAIIWLLRKIPLLGGLTDRQMEWIFFGIVFAVFVSIMMPLLKLSTKIALGAAALAILVAYVTSFSFWGVLPFTGLGVAIVLFSNKFQTD